MGSSLLTVFRVLWKRSSRERACRWTRAEIERHQLARVAELRRFALDRSPFYRRFHRGLEHRPLDELPILTKASVMENFDDLVTDRAIRLADIEAFLNRDSTPRLFRDRYVVLATSGSTGRRGIFLFDQEEWLTALAQITRPMAWAGVKGRLRKPPRSALIASNVPWHYSARISLGLSSRMLPSLRLDATEPLSTMVGRLNDWQPEILAAYPSVLRQLADAQLSGRLRIRPRSVATSAEVLTEETRGRAQRAWGVRVYDTYGATEYAPIAAECRYGSKHLYEDGAVIEIVDERGRAVAPGERGDRILLTIFHRRTQPLIRYEISDMVRPVAGECECGRKFQMISGVEGRCEEVLVLPSRDGGREPVPVHPNLFHQVLETVPAAGWQVVQEEDGLSVYLAGLGDPLLCEPIGRALRQLLEAQGALAPAIRICPVDALERGATGKAPLILSRPQRKADSVGRGQ